MTYNSPEPTVWTPLVRDEVKAKAIELATLVGERLRTLPTEDVSATKANLRHPSSPLYSLGSGLVGPALLFEFLDRQFPGAGWDTVAHQTLAICVESLAATDWETSPLEPLAGLYGGLTGFALAVHSMSRGGQRYRSLLDEIDRLLLRLLSGDPRLTRGLAGELRTFDYDIISGIVGIGFYALARLNDVRWKTIRDQVADRLIERHMNFGSSETSAFHLKAHWMLNPQVRMDYPGGATDVGVAHGVGGVVLFLSYCKHTTYKHPDLDQTLRDLRDVIKSSSFEQSGTQFWLSFRDTTQFVRERAHSRPAWCYGSGGMNYTLYVCERVLKFNNSDQHMERLVQAVRGKTPKQLSLKSPILCHGVAGTLQILLRYGNIRASRPTLEAIEELTRHLMNGASSEVSYIFRDMGNEGFVDDLGFLEGASGVALTLLAAATMHEPTWDWALGLTSLADSKRGGSQ